MDRLLPLPTPATPQRTHLRRMLDLWRSDGWPCKDGLDIELLAAGWVDMVTEAGHQKLRLTAQGMALLAAARQRNQRATGAHDRLAERVATQLHDAGRVVWRELSLRAKLETTHRAPVPAQALDLFPPGGGTASAAANAAAADAAEADVAAGGTSADAAPTAPGPVTMPRQASFEPSASGWRMARPDVFSVRNTSAEAYLHPVVHEVKVSRADLFSDLRHAAKRAAYQWLCCECHYVFPAGMAQPQELPPELGVWVLHGDADTGRLEQLRPARHTPCTLPFVVWLALAKASPWQPEREPRQAHLGQPSQPLPSVTGVPGAPATETTRWSD